jgi:two-component sensor histidine kinase
MNRRGLAQGVIDALPEPAFLLAAGGGVIGTNRAARAMLGREPAASLAGMVSMPDDEVRLYLERCGRTTTPLPGAMSFVTADGARRYRVHCARLGGQPGEAVLMLRCTDPREDRFSVLSEKIRQLDAELRRRVREKAVLRQALEENRNLMRELQHRVKNNIQMMISLLTMSAANSGSAEVRAFASGAKERFRALATTQDLIYEAKAASVVPARDLLGRLADAIAESNDSAVEVRVDIEDVWLPAESAHCLALIVNELITNSLKHGLSGAGTIRITLARQGDQIRLVVQDDGRGYPDLDALPRSSGLTLIRGLCRQIGASLELSNDNGAQSVIAMADGGAVSAPVGGAAPPDRERATPVST